MKNIYLYTGNEELIIKNKIDAIINVINPSQFDFSTYDMEIDDINIAMNDCVTLPFASEKKVVILKHPRFLEKGRDKDALPLGNYLDNPCDTTCLIIDATEVEIDDNNEVVKKIFKKAEVTDTRKLTDVEMKGWLKRQFENINVSIEAGAIDLFFEYVGDNLIKAKTEVDKLIGYIGNRKIVTIKDISECVTEEGETNIFALTKAIYTKDKNKIIDIYYSLLKSGNDQLKLLNLIYRSFKDSYTCLLLLEQGKNQNEIAKIMGVTPGRCYYIMKDASNFSISRLSNILVNIGDLDYKIKTGQIDKVSGMELFLFQL